MKIHNTLTQKKEEFKTSDPNHVKMYVCGPTVYDFLHIGNFRGAIVFNLFRNWLEANGKKVTYVYNYTDVDDKIIKRANDEGVAPSVISEKYIKEFEKDFQRLGLKKHDHNPKVTDYMDEIISFVKDLVDKEKAYVVDGEVFYAIGGFSEYGKLSKKKLDDLEAGQRVEVDSRKKNPHDFVLWKPSKEGEPSWKSPWGAGRPGWHIECSAMIQSIFNKETIDIHGGGIDLIFPHHENEIAQGEGRTGCQYCNYWMHNNFINMDGEKMSKSLGNVMKARDFMDKYHGEVLKYLFLSVHYRSMLSISNDRIQQVISALDRIYTAIELSADVIKNVSDSEDSDKSFNNTLKELDKKIEKSLNDDLNSAEFISFIFEGVRAFNALGFKNKKWNANHKANSEVFNNWIHKQGAMAALFQEEPREMINRLDEILIEEKNIDLKLVDELISKRVQAREAKNWEDSDKYRDELVSMGIELQDGVGKGWTIKK